MHLALGTNDGIFTNSGIFKFLTVFERKYSIPQLFDTNFL